ncbi:hypothetical protein [Streptomyces bobili]|uniref:hypothetical protein n=1 Tax=Streptomyces bobili TaxID=67280 RepID=UPI000A3CEE52|nr:hypothetical protein [Streptomyces bobili]
MSAPTTHDPVAVNTKDGSCWRRRAVTQSGRGLYALAAVQGDVPELVLSTLAELAEHGLRGMAFALPVPVGPGPVVRPLALHEAQIDALAASGNRAVNDAVHEDLCACDAWPEKCLSSGGFFQGYWDMGGLETAIPAVLGLWESMRGGELEPAPTTVYRAEHPDSGITLGHYGTESAARAHCEATERRSWPTGTSLSFDWIRDALPEDDENGIAVLVVTAGQNEESTTGYIVTALELASEYDAEADE